MSFTKLVPSGVPSLFQSSSPVVPSFAPKYNVFPAAVRNSSAEGWKPGLMSFTSPVPPLVPSLLPSSEPTGSFGSQHGSVRKYSAFPIGMSDVRGPVQNTSASAVTNVALVPLLFQSSPPSP